MAEQKQDADEKQVDAKPISKYYSFRRMFIVSRKHSHTLAIADDGKVTTTQNREMNDIEGLRLEKSAQDGVVFIASNKDPTKVLACTAENEVVTTSNRLMNGTEAWKLERDANYVTFIVSVQFGRVLAIDGKGKITMTGDREADGDEGMHVFFVEDPVDPPIPIFIHSPDYQRQLAVDLSKNLTTTTDRNFNGWEGLYLEPSTMANVYFIYSRLFPDWVLVSDATQDNKVYMESVPQRSVDGKEAWEFQYDGNGNQYIVSHTQKYTKTGGPLLLCVNKDHKVISSPNFGGWESFRLEIAPTFYHRHE